MESKPCFLSCPTPSPFLPLAGKALLPSREQVLPLGGHLLLSVKEAFLYSAEPRFHCLRPA